MSKGVEPQKKEEKPLIVFLRLYGEAKAKMKKICRQHSTDHNAVGMAGILAEMHRLETSAPGVSAEDAAALAEARRLGLDPVAALKAAALAHLASSSFARR